ncbi:MAG TPA: PAS domain S-box protein [Tepidisphaeraceae bacterium]|nr:PAS domain S-box protein [Tepidisphaeraceae bacterium]
MGDPSVQSTPPAAGPRGGGSGARASSLHRDELLARIIDASVDGVLAFDCQFHYTVWNPAMETIAGLPREQVIGRSALDLFPFLRQTGVDQLMARVLEGEHVRSVDLHYRIPETGRQGWYDVNYSPLLGDDGSVVGGLGIIRDVTQRKLDADAERQLARGRAEAALRESEQRFHGIFDQAAAGIAEVDTDGRFVLVNQKFCDITGYCADELLTLRMQEITHPDDLPRNLTLFDRGVTAGSSYVIEKRYIRKDGSLVWVSNSVSTILDPGGAAVRLCAVCIDVSDRKRFEQELNRSRQELQDFLDNATVGLHWMGPDGTILWANAAELEMLGHARGEYVGRHAGEFHVDAHVIADMLARLHAGGAVHNVEARLRCADGSIKHVLIDANVLWEEGRFVHTRCFTRDITKRKQAEDALRRSEQRYRSLVSASTQVVWTTSATGEVVEDLPTWRAFTGQTWEQIQGFGWFEAVHPDDRERVGAVWRESLRTGRPHENEFRARAADGSWRNLLARAVPVIGDDGGVREWIGTCTDVTDRRAAEDALRRSETRFRTLVEQSPLSTQIYAPDGRILQSNAAWERLFGVTIDDVRDYNILADPELEKHGVADVIRRAFAGEGGVVPQIPYCPDRGAFKGQPRWCGATIYPVRDEAGNVREIVLVHEDITERKAAEQQLERAIAHAEAANKAKDRFLAVLSHELRTPLTPVLATVSALEAQADLPRSVRADLEVIRRNVELETRLIDDLLDLTRITKGKLQLNLEPIDLRDLIERAVAICREDVLEKNLLLSVDLPPPGECYARADSARLQQVLWNLIKNAVKFTPPGGKIIVSWSRDDGGHVSVRVSDTGIGIEPGVMPRLFRAFEQGSPETSHRFGGLGLGLTISKALTELHRGTLSVHSDGRDKGATFTVRLPAAPKPASATPDATSSPAVSPAAPAEAPARPCRILLVEDHADTARIMLRLLRGHRYDVQWAGSIEGALKVAAEHPFDLVVSDLGLPDGSGLELMRHLRERYGLKGIALSGYGMEEDIRQSREAGFLEHLTKPVNFASLREMIQAVTTKG